MTMKNRETLADKIVALIHKILRQSDAPIGRVYQATFLNNNAVDANLCDIRMATGDKVAGCPRAKGTTYTSGDVLLVVRGPGTPLIVVCALSGDIAAINPAQLL